MVQKFFAPENRDYEPFPMDFPENAAELHTDHGCFILKAGV